MAFGTKKSVAAAPSFSAGIRPVNILTIKWLIYNGVKYIVE